MSAIQIARRRRDAQQLTERQMEVLIGIVRYGTYERAAEHLAISPRTAKSYGNLLVMRLGAEDKHDLLRAAEAHGLLKLVRL